MTGPEPLDELYAADPADFVARRKELARRLKDAGDASLAATVSSAKKPPKTAAALSDVARSEPTLVDELLESASAVGAAFRIGGAALRAAQSEYNAAVDAVLDHAVTSAGITSPAMSERMRATLLAAGAEPDGEVARQLRVGALRDDAAAPGFAFGLAGAFGAGPENGSDDGSADDDGTAAEEPRERPARRRLRSVSTGPEAAPETPDDDAHDGARGADTIATDDTAEADDAAELDTSLAERHRLADERAESERVANARREAMRRRRGLERELGRVERRVSRLLEAANEAEARAHVARSAADEASEELDALRARIADLDLD